MRPTNDFFELLFIFRKMAGQGAQHNIIGQMRMELEAARNRINALDEQSRKAAEEIAFLRNRSAGSSFGPQNGPRPLLFGVPPLPTYARPTMNEVPRPPQFSAAPAYQIPTMAFQTMPLPTSFAAAPPIPTMPIPTMSIPTMPIPTMSLPTFHYNGEVADSSH